MIKFALFVLLIFAPTLQAQTRTFKWDTEMCQFSGVYDPAKFTETQLRDTAKLILGGDYSLGIYTIWKYEEIAKIDLAAVERDFAEKSKALRALNIVKSPYWEAARQSRLRELEQRYRLTRTTLEAYTNPAVLKEYKAAPECAGRFSEPLVSGGDKLLQTWREVNLESRKKNSDPERIRREFESEYASPDRMKFALLEVMSFGWNNCAVRFVDYDERYNDGTYQEEFKKLFRNVKTLYCEEP